MANTQFKDIAFNGKKYVTVGETGNIATSNDGVNWAPQMSNITENLHSIEWVDGQFISVGEEGTIISSIDGDNWTSDPSLNSSRLTSIATNGKTTVIGGWDSGPKDNLFISTDEQKWSDLDILRNLQIFGY